MIIFRTLLSSRENRKEIFDESNYPTGSDGLFMNIDRRNRACGDGGLVRKKFVFGFSMLVFFGLALNAFANESSFKPGETIVYNIQQMGFKAGEASLIFKGPVTYEGKDTLLIVFTADGFNFYDREDIYLDPKTYKPLYVIRDLNIFGKKEKITEQYLSAEGKINISKVANGKKTETVFENKSVVDNLYGFIYRYRLNGSFKIGDKIDVHLPTKNITIELQKETKLSTAGQQFDAFYMQSDPAKYKLWFDAGPKRLPLRISGAIGIANTVMVMKEYKD